MKVSLLNEKIMFQKSTVVLDSIGNRRNVWQDYYSCFATIGGESGNEQLTADQNLDTVNISFTIRWCKTVSEITSTRYRIIFHDEIYDIHSVDHMNFKKKSIKLKCRKVRR